MLKDKNRFKKIYPYNRVEPQKQLILFTLNSYFSGGPLASQDILYYVFNRMIEIPKDFSKSILYANVAPTSNAIFSIYISKNGSLIHIANATILAGNKYATFETLIGVNQIITEGNVLIIRSPSTIDSTLEDISITISGDLLS
jgi:hypothetical protein